MDKPHAEPEPLRHNPGDGRPDPLDSTRRQARQRILDDRRSHPEVLGPIFEALAAGLFVSGFNANTAVAAPAARQFRLAVGVTPRAYLDRLLLDAALELVRETTLPIMEIAAGLGFDDPHLFAKWFKWRTGDAPTTMRPPSGDPPDHGPAPPAAETTDDGPPTDREWRHAAVWEGSPECGAAMIRKIRELYPALDDPTLSH